MRLPPSPTATALLILWSLFTNLHAVTMDEIDRIPNLTPERFAEFFSNFNFKFRDEVQTPEQFLSSQSGDCDDFAILASETLRRHGYTPRLIAVRMPKVVHVVCYIQETGSFLDYNVRAQGGIVRSGASIAEIARRVGRSYGLKWSSASEFTYDRGAKRLVQTVLAGSEKQIAANMR